MHKVQVMNSILVLNMSKEGQVGDNNAKPGPLFSKQAGLNDFVHET